MVDKKILLKKMVADIFESSEFDTKLIAKYFHPNYQQQVDGKTLNFDQFVDHIKVLKSSTNNITIKFEQLIAEGDSVCSIHYPQATKKDGKQIQAKVIAFFKFQDDKIIACDELTHLMVGDEQDKDLGSRC